MNKAFAAQLRDRIERQYSASGYTLGWRLLYSPEVVLEGARVAFLGLNPGGNYRPTDHAEFAMERGSAYEVEHWGGPPGTSKLQRQVLALFEWIGERPEAVLAGNLVPFRSPNWDALPDKQRALAFGKDIWADIFAQVSPQLVIAMGGEAITALTDILDVSVTDRIPVGWGSICGERGDFATGALVGIPHLSRFPIMTRGESRAGLRRLFNGFFSESVPNRDQLIHRIAQPFIPLASSQPPLTANATLSHLETNMGNLNEELVAATHYLEAAGMSEEQLSQLHHYWPRKRVTYWQTYDYFGKNLPPRTKNTRYAERLKFVAAQHRLRGESFSVLVQEALAKWPL